jgi:hypothetical protein
LCREFESKFIYLFIPSRNSKSQIDLAISQIDLRLVSHTLKRPTAGKVAVSEGRFPVKTGRHAFSGSECPISMQWKKKKSELHKAGATSPYLVDLLYVSMP